MFLDIASIVAMIQALDGALLAVLTYMTINKGENNVDGIFLIHDNGQVIKYVAREEEENMDESRIPEMLTVTQQFIKDSFAYGDGLGLKKLKLRDGGVLLEKGRKIYLAVIHTGDLTREQHKRVVNIIKDIESDYLDEIVTWDGGPDGFKGVDKKLQSLIIR